MSTSVKVTASEFAKQILGVYGANRVETVVILRDPDDGKISVYSNVVDAEETRAILVHAVDRTRAEPRRSEVVVTAVMPEKATH